MSARSVKSDPLFSTRESVEVVTNILSFYVLGAVFWVVYLGPLRGVAVKELGWICALPFPLIALLCLLSSTKKNNLTSQVFTLANLVTAIRLAALVYFCRESQNDWLKPGPWLSVSMLVFMALDYVDGYLAKSRNACSLLGGFFDEETDSLAVLSLCMYVYSRKLCVIGGFSCFNWIPGISHYLFYVVKRGLGLEWPPRQPFARFLAGFCWFIAAAAFIVEGNLQVLFLALSFLGNFGSFGYSYYQMFFPQRAFAVAASGASSTGAAKTK